MEIATSELKKCKFDKKVTKRHCFLTSFHVIIFLLFWQNTGEVTTMPRIKIDDILKLGDFVSIVHEPDYSKSMLEQLQDKYGIETKIFIGNEDFFPQVNPEDARDWKFYYSIYLNAGGILDDLTPPYLTSIAFYYQGNTAVGQAQTRRDENVSPSFYVLPILEL